MPKREECRKCGAKLKHDKTSNQYDPDYCSGLCRKNDGVEPYIKSVEELAMVVEATKKAKPASLEDYKKNVPSKYARRFEPEKLNWSENVMNAAELKQAGFRCNREPIPGDWDFVIEETEEIGKEQTPEVEKDTPQVVHLNEWQTLKAKAKALGINTHAKNKEQIEEEIQEKEKEDKGSGTLPLGVEYQASEVGSVEL